MKSTLFMLLAFFPLSVPAITFNEYVQADHKSIQDKQDLKAFSNESPEVARCLVDRYSKLLKEFKRVKDDATLLSSLKDYCKQVNSGKDVSRMRNVISNYKYRGVMHNSIYVLARVEMEPKSCKEVELSGDAVNRGRYWFVGSEDCSSISFK